MKRKALAVARAFLFFPYRTCDIAGLPRWSRRDVASQCAEFLAWPLRSDVVVRDQT